MAFPPRPRSSRAEPSFAPAAAPARDAVPLRPAAPRAAARPGAGDTVVEREMVRFPAENRRGADALSISLNASDRLVVSSASAGDRKGLGLLRILGFALLLMLAGFGAYSLYNGVSGFLP
jgi:hypothetical protein